MNYRSSRDIAYVKCLGSIEARELDNGQWRACIGAEMVPLNPNYCPCDYEVVRDNRGYVITRNTVAELIDALKEEYPNWEWE